MSDVVLQGAADKMLAEAETPAEFVDVLRLAEAARTFARQANLGPQHIDKASRTAAKALIGLATSVDQMQAQGVMTHGGDRSKNTGSTLARLKADVGFHSHQLHDGRLLAQAFPDGGIIDAIEGPKDGLFDGRAQIVTAARRIVQGTDEAPDDWYTPRWLFNQLGVTFDVDVCAPRDPASRTVPARRYYTEDDDGLTQPWHGMVWCNPPYSGSEPWAQRFTEHGNGIWLSLARNGKWLIPFLNHADVMRMWVQAKFTLISGQENSVPNAELLVAYGADAADALAAADLGEKISAPLWRRP